jgi:hypothetical protein
MEQPTSFSSFESTLAKIVSQTDSEKTKHDKLVSRDEVSRSRDILRKEKQTIEEVKEVMSLTVGNELKQLNTEDYERIVFGKWQLRAEDHASVLIEFLEQSRELEKGLGEPITENEKREFEQAKQIRAISERKLIEEHRKNIDGFFYLNRSSLSLNSKGLDYFAAEQKSFKYNVPSQNVPSEHMK